MKNQPAPGAHLTEEEVVLRVFPVGDGVSPVPLHLAACPACQSRVARLRESALVEQGAVEGALGALPEEFWEQQELSVMQQVRSAALEKRKVLPFRIPLSGHLLRRPALAVGSLAAAILLVTALSLTRGPVSSDETKPVAAVVRPTPLVPALSEADKADDELLLSVDHVLAQDSPGSLLVPEDV